MVESGGGTGGVSDLEARSSALSFRIGARTLLAIKRQLLRVPVSLDEAREGRIPALPQLPAGAHGYFIPSLAEAGLEPLIGQSDGMRGYVRQRYNRYYAELSGTFDGYLASLSSNARQSVRRKAKRVAKESGGELDVRRYRTPEELKAFHGVARKLALRTYQERLLGEGLPDTPEFVETMLARGTADEVRAWLLYIGEAPAAYLYCPAHGETLIYEYVGHDPAFNDLSPGAVLQIEAFKDLFEEGRFARFDFTEGEGQHKRQFSTGGVPCVDLLLLRPSLSNRAIMAALNGFDRAVAGAKGVVDEVGLEKLARKLRRG